MAVRRLLSQPVLHRVAAAAVLVVAVTIAQAVTVTVNTIGDAPDGDPADDRCDTGNEDAGFTGLCSLRAALVHAEPGDTIVFGQGIDTIRPTSELPPLHASLVGGAGSFRLVLDGSLITDIDASGLHVRSGAEQVTSLVMHRFPHNGIEVNTGTQTVTAITNCIIGLDATGTIAEGYGNGAVGIAAFSSDDLTIGGSAPGAGNVISGNESEGIWIFGRNFLVGAVQGTRIIGNRIGTDASGTLDLGNGRSGVVLGEHDLAIVDTIVHDNVISGNGAHGVEVRGKRIDANSFGLEFNRITGNRIGTNQAGTAAIPNAGSGIFFSRNDESFVGDPDDPVAGRNLISGNLEHGIAFGHTLSDTLTVVGNLIGTDASGNGPLGNGGHGIYLYGGVIGQIGFIDQPEHPNPLGNVIAFNAGAGVGIIEPEGSNTTRFAIRGNAIHSNGGLGIDIDIDGPTANDDLDLDGVGGNNRQNRPILTDVTIEAGMTTVQGFLDDVQNNPHRFDFYANPGGCDIHGFGEGAQYLGAVGPLTNPSFRAPILFTAQFAGEYPNVVATATDVAGNTSEFSSCGVAFVVNSTADTGDQQPGDGLCFTGDLVGETPECTLRAAIQEGNASPGRQTVEFDIPDDQAVDGSFEILVQPSLPIITESLVIDATTQDGYQPGAPVVEINGEQLGNNPGWGFQVEADESALRGLAVHSFASNGVLLNGADRNLLQASIIGTTADNDPDTKIGEHGVYIRNSAGNLIGGLRAGDRNVISRSGQSGTGGWGIHIEGNSSTNNQVLRNHIGTTVGGDGPLGNGGGVLLFDAPGNHIGSAAEGGNVISGNGTEGVMLLGPGAAQNTIAGNVIGLDGTAQAVVPNGRNGILIGTDAGSGNLIGGTTDIPGTGAGNVIGGNQFNGIRLLSGGQRVLGNIVGTNFQGAGGLGNAEHGVRIESTGNVIGGVDPRARNVISGNESNGIHIAAQGAANKINGNYVGTDRAGSGVRSNLVGIAIAGSADNLIGVEAGNVISGNLSHGIQITGNAATGNLIQGNVVGGTADDPPSLLGNANDGIRIEQAGDNRVGPGNVILGNGANGLAVVGPMGAEGNLIIASTFRDNTLLAIDLADDAVTLNDDLDPDAGPNRLQNYPEVTMAVGAPLKLIEGELGSAPNRSYVIEVFSNSTADPSGNGEGAVFEGAFPVDTDASGAGAFTAGFGQAGSGDCISLTAIDVQTGDTSELSPCVVIVDPPETADLDFGDAPPPYPTRLVENGARHVAGIVHLGASVDIEPDGQPTDGADGDDTNGTDDDQGVTFAGPVGTYLSQASVTVVASGAGQLNAWIDFNGDGDWTDPSDHALDDVVLGVGVNVLDVTIPPDAQPGFAGARFRFSTQGNLAPIGPALNGEVEDYLVEILGETVFGDGFEQ